MDDLIDELMDLYESYHEAKMQLKDCLNDYGEGEEYICLQHTHDCAHYKSEIKATIKKIVDISKGE